MRLLINIKRMKLIINNVVALAGIEFKTFSTSITISPSLSPPFHSCSFDLTKMITTKMIDKDGERIDKGKKKKEWRRKETKIFRYSARSRSNFSLESEIQFQVRLHALGYRSLCHSSSPSGHHLKEGGP